MKITPIQDAVSFLTVVREKKDGGDGHPREQKQKQQNKDDSDENQKFHVDEESLGAAVNEFQVEDAAKSNGLQANMSGNGPGLKVVLTDATGQVVRQFTGEEFLKLREAAQAPKRGRLLDQKF